MQTLSGTTAILFLSRDRGIDSRDLPSIKFDERDWTDGTKTCLPVDSGFDLQIFVRAIKSRGSAMNDLTGKRTEQPVAPRGTLVSLASRNTRRRNENSASSGVGKESRLLSASFVGGFFYLIVFSFVSFRIARSLFDSFAVHSHLHARLSLGSLSTAERVAPSGHDPDLTGICIISVSPPRRSAAQLLAGI